MQLHHAFIASVLALSTAAAPAATGVDTAERGAISNWAERPPIFAPEPRTRCAPPRAARRSRPPERAALRRRHAMPPRGHAGQRRSADGRVPSRGDRADVHARGPLRHPRGGEGDLAERDGRQSRRPWIPGAVRAGSRVPDRFDAQLPREHVVANAAVVPLSATGAISVAFGVSGGDLVIDTNGYFAPLGVVNSLNGQGGDLTLAQGANVTLTRARQHADHQRRERHGPDGSRRVRRVATGADRRDRCHRSDRLDRRHGNVRHAVRALVHGLDAAPQLPARSGRGLRQHPLPDASERPQRRFPVLRRIRSR